jgi:hypothetical protein
MKTERARFQNRNPNVANGLLSTTAGAGGRPDHPRTPAQKTNSENSRNGAMNGKAFERIYWQLRASKKDRAIKRAKPEPSA